MHESAKKFARETLTGIWVETYSGHLDMEGNWIAANGRVVKWELRDGKAHEPWCFSISLAMGLAALLQASPQEIAASLAKELSQNCGNGWSYQAVGGYVNAYFAPNSLADYGQAAFKVDFAKLQSIEGAQYAQYRLEVIRKALICRGVKPFQVDEPLPKSSLLLWGDLFLIPQSEQEWTLWMKRVSQMTAEGRLIDLEPSAQSALLTFLNEI